MRRPTAKQALVEVATTLFTEQGYAATSLDTVVAGAAVTKGALYHHFTGKQALFEAAFERVEAAAAADVQRAMTGIADPWQRASAGLRAFLDLVQQPGYRRIVIQDGPAVLGHERFREQEERTAYGVVEELIRSVLADLDHAEGPRTRPPAPEDALIGTFARIFCGALSAAGESVSQAEDPRAAADRVEAAIGYVLRGLHTLVDRGELPAVETGGSATSR